MNECKGESTSLLCNQWVSHREHYQECCHLFPVITLHFTTRYHHADLEMFKLLYQIKVNGLNSVTHPEKRSNDCLTHHLINANII